MRYATQALVFILITAIVFLVVQTPIFPYTPIILGFLALIALIYTLYKRKKRKGQEIFVGSNIEVFVILLFILLIVFLTGGIKSPIFFLTYFILFGLAFIFEPIMIFFFLTCLAILFIPQVIQDDILGNSVKLASLLILTPIAFFFGREYKRREKLQAAIKAKTDIIITDAKEVIETKDKNERLKKAEEIIEEAEELKKESE